MAAASAMMTSIRSRQDGTSSIRPMDCVHEAARDGNEWARRASCWATYCHTGGRGSWESEGGRGRRVWCRSYEQGLSPGVTCPQLQTEFWVSPVS